MTGRYRVIYSPAALEELKSIYSYIAFELEVAETAQKQANRIRKGIKGLDTFPNGHAQVDWEPWCSLGMRKLPIDNYVVYYLANSENSTVTIIRIFYGGRNVENIINENNE